ncbi:hypothetical protein CDL60_24855 [Roseateles noduli]|nr:hypothetical protein CDL60_24855 [Roseateles noduli]
MTSRLPLFHRHGHYDVAAAQAHHQAHLAGVTLAPATESILREALGRVLHPSTPEGAACRRELMTLLDAAARPPAADRPMPTLQQAKDLLDRTRFDVRCNPEAVAAISESARALAKRYALHQTHIPKDVGKKLHLLRDELHRLARTTAGSGVKASRLRQLDQQLEAQRLVIEGCSRRVQGWREISGGSLPGLRRTTGLRVGLSP